MADNTIGAAWVSTRLDMTGFTTELTAGVTAAIARPQAMANALSRPRRTQLQRLYVLAPRCR